MDLKNITNQTLQEFKGSSTTFDNHKFSYEEFINTVCNIAGRLPDMSSADKLKMFIKAIKQKASNRYDINFIMNIDVTAI